MNMFSRFDENLAMTLQDIKETKCYGRMHAQMDGRTDGQRENSIPTTNKVCGGIKNQQTTKKHAKFLSRQRSLFTSALSKESKAHKAPAIICNR